MKRRDFLKKALCTTCSSAMFGSMLGKISLAHAAIDTTGYRALVGIYLYGGNDSFNMVVPRGAGYATYQRTRGTLALPSNTLRALTPAAGTTPTNGAPSDGGQYALHPNMEGLAQLFHAGRVGVVGNVGPLVRPVTKAEYQNDTAELPPQIGSHSDQSVFWQTPTANATQRVGWGGRLVDMYMSQLASANPLASISLDGDNVFQAGVNTAPYFLSGDGVSEIDAIRGTDPQDWNARRRRTFDALMAAPMAHPMQRTYRDTMRRTREMAAGLAAAIAVSEAAVPNTAAPYNAFNAESYIGRQLRMVTRMLAIRAQPNSPVQGLARQMFLCGFGGFDTHAGQLPDHAELMLDLSSALKAFHDALVALNLVNSVTAFTMSEFGRTLTNNGDGTDHGWGGHQLVMGGAVNGQRFYGHMPNLAHTGNSDDLDSGQIIPRVAVDQYAATLAKWYGLPDSDRATLFPNLSRFGAYGGANLGFLSA